MKIGLKLRGKHVPYSVNFRNHVCCNNGWYWKAQESSSTLKRSNLFLSLFFLSRFPNLIIFNSLLSPLHHNISAHHKSFTNYILLSFKQRIINSIMSRTVEVTVLSAENLQMNRKPARGNTFVTVHSDASTDAGAVTKVDSEGGSYPSWNEKVVVNVPLHARFISVEVKCKTSSSSSLTGSNSVGVARIPVSDFIGGYVPENQLHFLSYRLWDGNVRRNGVINISVRVKVPERSSCSSSSMSFAAVTGVPVAGNGSTGVVTGIPALWLNYQRNPWQCKVDLLQLICNYISWNLIFSMVYRSNLWGVLFCYVLKRESIIHCSSLLICCRNVMDEQHEDWRGFVKKK